MEPVLLMRNDRYETFGVAPTALAWAGLDVRTANLIEGASLPRLDEVSGVIAFGGTANVDQVDRFPYLRGARDYTSRALDRGVPYLGICLGAQLLARAAGEEVFAAPVKEVGFEPLRPTGEAKEDPLLSQYVDGDMVFQWHEDTYRLPAGATLLASGDRIDVEAFRVGDRAWGVQFHQELDALELGWWLEIAEAEMDVEATWGKSGDRIRGESARHMPAHEERGRELFRRFAEVVRDASR
ncbi:MAG TPA: type 1 glutamine amidotransferase [Actinomycetota bacterium]|jgi:GMP synthase-like glutamine amidotransferase|nr:type 1 glutamine amidotransferase [Actinomycetota bacterium]